MFLSGDLFILTSHMRVVYKHLVLLSIITMIVVVSEMRAVKRQRAIRIYSLNHTMIAVVSELRVGKKQRVSDCAYLPL